MKVTLCTSKVLYKTFWTWF